MGRWAQARRRASDRGPGLPPGPDGAFWTLEATPELEMFATANDDGRGALFYRARFRIDGGPWQEVSYIDVGTPSLLSDVNGVYDAQVRYVDIVGEPISEWSAIKQETLL